MNQVEKGQIWQNLIGPPTEFVVDTIYSNGWVNGRVVKTDGEGKKTPVNGTGFAAHENTMLLTMKRVG